MNLLNLFSCLLLLLLITYSVYKQHWASFHFPPQQTFPKHRETGSSGVLVISSFLVLKYSNFQIMFSTYNMALWLKIGHRKHKCITSETMKLSRQIQNRMSQDKCAAELAVCHMTMTATRARAPPQLRLVNWWPVPP